MGEAWTELRPRAAFASRALVLDFAVRAAHSVEGNIVEFSVFRGASTRVLRDSLTRLERGQLVGRRKRIFACDSFKRLPEAYGELAPGTFASPPPRIRGVEIVEGYYKESLTAALARRVGRVSLASLDCDATGIRTIQVAQFLREPSGGKSGTLDRRVLFQVVGEAPYRSRWIITVGNAVPTLRAYVRDRRRKNRQA